MAITTAAWTWEQVLEWMNGDDAPEEVQTLSEKDRIEIARDVARALEERMVASRAQKVYEELESDPNVTGAGISSQSEHRPQNVIPRGDFPPQVFMLDEDGFEKRSRTEPVELVLLRPVLTKETNKRWGFKWPHGKLGAVIKDEAFLNSLAAGKLGISMSEGIVFRVNLEITEERREGVWVVKEYAVLKVLEIMPPLQQDHLSLD